tara:strand:- start:1772 stop:2221 length:450 start_codon:yes stop_codon:yes gene_type:complete
MKNFKENEIVRSDVTAIRDELNKAIADKLAELGLDGEFGSASYDANTVSFKVQLARAGCLSRAEQEKRDSLVNKVRWDSASAITEAQAEEFVDMVHEVRGQKIRLTGYNFRAKKMPVEFEKVGAGTMHKGAEIFLTLAVQKHFGALSAA